MLFVACCLPFSAKAQHVTIGGSVFGGGNMAAVGKGTTVLIDQADAQITGDVYGGGALAEVDTTRKSNPFTTLGALQAGDSIVVTILQGSIGHDVYGGGLGNAGTAANVYGPVIVNIGTLDGDDTLGSATINGMVFGGNNINGTPKDSIHVNIWKTARGGAKEVGSFTEEEFLAHIRDNASAHSASSFALQAVYGGSNKADYVPVAGKGAKVWVHGCSNTVKMLYGGGRAAAVGSAETNDPTVDSITANTFVIVDGGRIDTLFAGGDGHTTDGSGNYLPADIHGNVNAHVRGGFHTAVFGASNTAGSITGNKDITIDKSGPCEADPEAIGTLFGGGNMADAQGNLSLTVECGAGYFNEVYGGCNLADVINGNVVLTINGGHIGNVYGGSKGRQGSTPADSANIGGNVTLNLHGGTMTNAFGGSNINGNITGSITVNVEDTSTRCPLSVDTVYGAGNLTAYTPNTPGAYPEVNIKNGTVGGNVYGGGFGPSAIVTSNPVVTIGDVTEGHEGYEARVGGSIYGSGYAASVTGNTTVVMTKANSSASKLFGGGANAGVTGNTSVTLTNGTVLDGIFGGSDTTGTITGNTVIALNGGYAGTDVHPANYGICGGGWGLDTRVGGNVTLTLNGTSVNGELYGGSYYGNVNTNSSNTTTVTLTSGSVMGNVYGGGFGDSESGAYALVNGAVTVNANGATVNGNIFGCNNDNGAPQSTVAVSFTGGSAYGVFGGGNLASYGGTPVITVSGGTITKRVVGGGNAAGVGGSSITISNGDIATDIDQPGCGVFGGCYTSGEVDGDIIVSVTGGTIGTDATHRANIHGGGYGDETSSTGDVTVTFGNSNVSHQNSPVLYGDLYGGSGFGNVNESTSNTTTVNVLNGEITGDVYGGGLGQKHVAEEGTPGDPGYVEEIPAYPALVNGDVVVNIGASPSTGKVKFNTYDGGDKGGRVFGANNANGTPKGNVSVNIYATDHGSGIANNEYPSPAPTTASALATNAATQTYAIAAVFGGGNEASYTPVADKSATVHVYNCDNTIKDVYGGGNAADVGTTGEGAIPANTYVVIDGGRIHRVFGGGNGEVTPANTYGTATTTVNAGLIDQIFGCGNMQGSITATDLQLLKTGSCSDEVWGEIFGGANLAAITSDLSTTIDCGVGTIGDIYGGSNKASITGNVALTVKGGIYTNVYGGSKGIRGNGSSILDTAANIGGNVTLNLHGGTITNAFGGSNANGNIGGSIIVNVLDYEATGCELDITNIYGAGNLTAYTPADNTISYPQVNIKHIKSGNSIHGNVFGGGKQASVTANPVVNIGNGSNGQLATISGNVFGGGDEAGVNGATTVNMISGSVATGLYGGCNTSGTVSGDITVALTGGTVGVDGTTTDVVYGGGYGHNTSTGGDVSVTLGAATVHGNLYGGSALGSVGAADKTTTVTIGGSNLHGSVFGGGMGSGSEASTQATTNGNVVVHYNAVNTALTGLYGGANVNGDVAGDIAVYIDANIGSSAVGDSLDIFGGGKGQYTTTGGDVTVTVGNTATLTLYGDIYGGSEEGEVGDEGTLAKIDFKKGTLSGTLFGGGKGKSSPAITAAVNGGTEVTVTAGSVSGGIYGGANINGTVAESITVNVNGGAIGADAAHAHVFGGGYGKATATDSNVTVNINGATVWGDVYGGSGFGNVNNGNTDTTTVNILAGIVKGDVYGGGLGDKESLGSGHHNYAAAVNGEVFVNIGSGTANTTTGAVTDLAGSATLNGDVYGCNNTNGSPKDNVTINIYRTAHTTTDAASYRQNDGKGEPTYAIGEVFGGGNLADYSPAAGKKATVNVYTCDNTVRRVFGGGNAAAALGVATNIYGGRYDKVFGGGNGESSAADIGTGGTDLKVHGGYINQLFGGSNTSGTITGSMAVAVDNASGCGEKIEEFFGGSNAVQIGTALSPVAMNTTIGCGSILGDVYGGCNLADIYGNVTLTINGGTIDNVYAGSKGQEGNTANDSADITGNVTLNIYGGAIGNAFGGSNINGNITGNIQVNMDWTQSDCAQKSINNIYGASNLAEYHPTSTGDYPEVNIISGTVTKNVFGGGLGTPAIVNTSNPKVTIGVGDNADKVAIVRGSVFGGGDAAAVTGSTTVIYNDNSTASRVSYIYGGGNNIATNGVSGNTSVTLTNGTVDTGIYGGCNLRGIVRGNSTVALNGGTVGSFIEHTASVPASVTGRIFGGGYGESTKVDGNVHVILNGASVDGDIYGGSAFGDVNTESTHLEGTVNTHDSVIVDILSGSIRGTVYGGGLGRKGVAAVPAHGEPGDDDYTPAVSAVDPILATVHGVIHVNIGAAIHETSDKTGEDTITGYTGSADFNVYDLTDTTKAGGSVYGCNNTNGSPQHNVYVDVYQCYRESNELASAETDNYSIADVLGGGNAADYAPDNGDVESSKRPKVTVHGCDNTINRVFGGCNAADAVGTDVTVEGGRYNELFGGGNGAVKAANIGEGGTKLKVRSGHIGYIFGACNRHGTVSGEINIDTAKGEYERPCGDLVIDNHFFGGNFADIMGEKVFKVTCAENSTYRGLYGGCRLGTVYGNLTLIIEGGNFTNVYAGSLGAGDYAANIRKYPTREQLHADSLLGVTDEAKVRWKISPDIHKLWQDTKAFQDSAGTGGNLTLILRGGNITNAFGGCNQNGSAEGRITVIIDSLPGTCPLDLDYVYGGSNMARYRPNDATITSPIVELRSGHVNYDVFGGGHGSSDNVNAGLVTSNPLVVMGGDKWIDTNYLRVTHDIRWVDANVSKDFWVKGNIYGGGEMGSVGLYERSSGAVTSCTANTGKITVDLRSGTVGPAEMPIDFLTAYGSQEADTNFQRDRIVGMVFGGSKGAVGDTTSNPLYSHIAYANETEVIIGNADHTGPFIKGSVYGGAQNGRVYRGGTYVKIQGGQIGCGAGQTSAYSAVQWAAASTAVENADTAAIRTSAASMPECPHWVFGRNDNNGNGKGVEHLPYDLFATNSTADARPKGSDGHTFYGNVFGGGSGYFPYAQNQWLRTAGQVFGSTKVEITGGHILTNLYGGNELTDVTGDSCVVIMTGGTLGVPRPLDSITKHPVTCYLFGAGKGDERTHFNTWTNVQNVRVSVSGDAHIYGSLFGGGEDGHVMRNVKITFQDGVLGTTGTSYVDGNVFGGGRGFKGEALTAGNVGGDITIDISGDNTTKVLGSVYGGGRLASVGYGLYPTESPNYGKIRPDNQDDAGNTVEGFSRGHITIDIHGSATIGNEIEGDYRAEHSKGGNVFGSSMGRLKKLDDSYLLDLWQKLGSSKQTIVNIYEQAHVRGNVYGGSELGSVTDSTSVNIYGDAEIGHLTGGTHYHGDVYGGGYGISTEKFDLSAITRTTLRDSVQQYAGRVYGSTAVNVYGNATLHGDVYGGGEMASVGTEDSLHRGNTLVNIGEYNGGDYRGEATILGGDVYGCNNIAGTPLGNAVVNIYSTAHTATDSAIFLGTPPAPGDSAYALANVFGGGNKADYRPNGDPSSSTKKTMVHVYGCANTIEDLYSGGNAAYAYGVATTIDGGRFKRVFGGGNGEVDPADIGLGGTNTRINAGIIHQLFGGSNMNGTLAGPVNTVLTHTGDCPEDIYEFYAGSNEAAIVGDITTIVECTTDPEKLVNVEEFYGGCNLTDIYGNVTLIVNGGRFGHLFGGSKGSALKPANIKRYDADHYPAGQSGRIGTGGNVTLYIYGGDIERAFGGSDVNGNIEGAINVYVNDTSTHCALDLDYVYGGGDRATNVVSDPAITSPYVHLLNGIVNHTVFGGGRGNISNDSIGRTTGNAKVEMHPTGDDDFWVKGNIYGGGELAYVGGNDTVIINGGKVGPYVPADGTTRYTLRGCVYGGGLGSVESGKENFARICGNTVVSINGTTTDTIHGSVFGGGENAKVYGDASVTVAGGVIGVPTKYTGALSDLNTYVGNVYGGGRGIDLNATGYLSDSAGLVRGNTSVAISAGHICRNVYGGGSLAAVGIDGSSNYMATNADHGRTTVNVTGGLIGNYVTKVVDAKTVPDTANSIYGSVFGGGRGLPGHSLNGKNVYRNHNYVNNTNVTINYPSVDALPTGTSHIVGNVYGGAENGSVNNNTSVTITGGRIGSDGNKGFGPLEGNVYAGGCGEDTYKAYLRKKNNLGVYKYVNKTNDDLQDDTTGAKIVDSLMRYSGWVAGDATVLINGANKDAVQVMRHVYGGGSLATVGTLVIADSDNNPAAADGRSKGEVYRTQGGVCTVTITGGTLGTTGSNNGMVFGGCRGVEGAPGSDSDTIAYYYEGRVTIGAIDGADTTGVLVDFDNPQILINGSVYGGGENGHGLGDTWVTIHDGKIGNHDDLYDEAENPGTTAERREEIYKSLLFCGNVYGGGCGTDKYHEGDTVVYRVIDGARTKLTSVHGGDSVESVWRYNPYCGVVYGNTHVYINGGYVERNVYGGGSMANVGRRVGEIVQHTDESSTFALSWPTAIIMRAGTGNTDVYVRNKARIGYSGKENGGIYGAARGEAGPRYEMARYANVRSTRIKVDLPMPAGYDYSKSESEIRSDYVKQYATVIPMVAGPLYGGAENGQVQENTSVTLVNGIVGHSFYGGGEGRGTYTRHNLKHLTAGSDASGSWRKDDDSTAVIYSLSAGRVYGNTQVIMQGGHVVRCVYGGGNLGSIGKGNYAGGPGVWQNRGYGESWTSSDSPLRDTLASSGTANVTITGGYVGTSQDMVGDLPSGNVFGGCRGEAAPVISANPRYYYSPAYFLGYTNRTNVIIGGSVKATPDASSPHIRGSVYGAGQDGHVRHKAVVTINDGEIGLPYGSPAAARALVGVPSASDIEKGDYKLDDIHWTARGNVFGAGSGLGQYDSDGDGVVDSYNEASGSVTDSTRVVINGGLIHQTVFGGGALASIGPMILPGDVDKTPDSLYTIARVFINGGQIGIQGDCKGMYIDGEDTTEFGRYGGHVYGGGRGIAGIAYKNFNNVHHTHVHATGGTVVGDIYGGARDGHIISHTWVDVHDGVTVGFDGLNNNNGNIFAGGRGTIPHYSSGRVGGSTHLTVDGGTIYGSLFGGGRSALVGVNENGAVDATLFTDGKYDSIHHGSAYITVKGSPRIGNPDSVGLLASDYSVGDIFGSGKGDVDNYEDVTAGRVMNAYIHISETPRIYGAVFGGGEMAGVGWWLNQDVYTPLSNGFAPCTGTTRVTVTGCDTIGTHYEYTQPYLADHGDWTVVVDGRITHACTGNIVGGSQGDVYPESPHWISMAHSRESFVDISGDGIIMGNVYGGAEQGVVLENTDVKVSGCTIGTLITGAPDSVAPDRQYYFGSVFGGGYGREVTPPHYNDSCDINVTSRTVKSVVNPSEDSTVYDTTYIKFVEATLIAGRTYGNTTVRISDSAIVRENVYGGGNMASVGYVREDANHKYDLIDSTRRSGGLCTVEITGGIIGPTDHTQLNGSVYGGGKGVGNDPDEYFKNYCNVHNTDLTVSGGHIYGSTFGGGADCHVLGHTRTTIHRGAYIGSGEDTQEYDGCVFGGGRNAQNINHTAGRVQGHTYIIVDGGRIRRTIFGGGALARTGVDTNGRVDAFLKGNDANGIPIYDSLHHGSTFISVSGDTIPVNGVAQQIRNYSGVLVDSTGFSVADSILYHDYLGTTRTTDDGKIVVYYTAIGAYDGAVLVDNDYTIGDIFGGGKGDTKDTVDIMAGRVMNTHVHITKYPRIMADIYAGGEMSSVGWWDTNRYVGAYGSSAKNSKLGTAYTNTGYTKLRIDDNPYTGTPFEFSSANIHGGRAWTLIDEIERLYHTCSGNVYGGGQGYVEEFGSHRENWVHMGHVRNTSVEVNGGRFMGNCFGGGARGIVKEDCHVKITGGRFGTIIQDRPIGYNKPYYYYGSVFGGGYGNHKRFIHINDSSFVTTGGDTIRMVPTEQAGRVYGNTHVEITGGHIMDCVYGGGDMASTGYVERDSATGVFLFDNPSKRHGGVCNVEISGNTIVGPLDYNGHNAYVYAAGRGIGYDPTDYTKTICNVNEAHLTVSLTTTGDTSISPNDWNPATHGGRIWGSVFGGGADSHVLDSVSVVVHSGIVGTQGTTSYDGNIFGGGRNYLNTNHTNGRVQGNIHVMMDGGGLTGTIFGGGRLAMSGIDTAGHYIDSLHGNVDILVRGNAIIGNCNGDSLLYADESCGDIFGSGKGDIANYADVWAGRVTNAKITVKDTVISGNTYSPRIYGSIFGGGEMASLGYWDDTIKNGSGEVVFHTDGSGGTEYGKMYENTGRAVINLSGNLTVGSALEYTVAPYANPGEWTIYESTATDTTLLHTCTGNVFGGSQGDVDPTAPRWVSMGRSASAVVNISGGTYYGNIFGGSEQGIVTGDTRLNISGGNFGYTNQEGAIHTNLHKVYTGDIYAAGYGSDDPSDNAIPYEYDDDEGHHSIANPINDSTADRETLGLGWTPDVLAGRTYGDSRVDLTGGTVQGSVYGGGSFASVGYERSSAKGNTTVNIGKASQVGHAEQGPTIKGEVYGGNNFFGTPYGNTNVHIYSTAHTLANTAPTADYTKTLLPHTDSLTSEDVVALPYDDENFALSAVYGGGNKAAHSPFADDGSTLVHVHYCEENTIKTIYGGGNAANTKNNHVVIEGGRIYEVFGGGNGAGVGNPGADVNGTAWTEIHGGLISEVFGGSNSKGDVNNTRLEIEPDGSCAIMVANTYGGGNEAAGGGGEVTLMCGTNIGTFYGGSRNADLTGDIVLNVYGGKYESIFGGSKGTESRPANITGNVTVNFYGGHVQRLFGGSDVNGNVTGNIVVNVDIDPDYDCADSLHLDTVYGGGRNAAYTPDVPTNGSPLVNIMNNRYKPAGGGDSAWVKIQDVFGGGLGATAQVTSYPRVIIGGFGGKRGVRIYGNVYGGGSAAPVVGNTYVMVRDATIGRDNAAGSASSGIVFGGGYGSTSNVDGKTHVGIFGLSDIKNNVYGGGNAGIVNGSTELQIAYQEQIQPVDVAIRTVVTPNPPGAPIVAIKASLTCATPGVSIRYVTKPTEQGQPSATNGTLWDGTPFTIDWSDTLQAVAYLPGSTPGTIDSSMIPSMVTFGKAAKPVIKIDGDTVKISSSPGVRILYTMDGSEPGRNADGTLKTGTRIHNPVQGKAVLDTVLTDTNQVVKAVSERIGNYPSVVSVLTCEAPTVTISGDQCTITGPAGSKLYYTIDLTNPRSSMAGGTAHGTYVNGNTVTFTLPDENTVVKAIAKKSGYLTSPAGVAVYQR